MSRLGVSTMNSIFFSNHSSNRMNGRKISGVDIQTCIRYGAKLHRTGIKFYVLLSKQIQKYNLPQKLEGLCVLISPDNKVITTYKNKDAIYYIKRLSKDNLKKFSLETV